MMKLGFLSSIVPEFTFEQVIDFAAENGFKCVELASWPVEKAARRYAGVTHINTLELDDEKVEYIKKYCEDKGVFISAIAYYPNPLNEDLEARQKAIDHIKECIIAAEKLNVGIVNTFIGRVRRATPDENWDEFLKVWPPVIEFAQQHGVKIAIENCPMFFWDEWPNGDNLACSPEFWDKMFDAIKSGYFGLNYDPSHLVYQRMNYLKVVEDYKDKIFHFHAKDAKFYQEKYDYVGAFALPLKYHSPKLVGQGDIDWGKMVAALNDIRYSGAFIIEVEDRAYEDTLEDRLESILICRDHLKQFIH